MGNSDMELRDITYSQPNRNYITVQANGGSFYKMDIPLNSKECQLLLDKMFINESWDLSTDSILTLSSGAPMGFYSGVSEFEIMQLDDTSMIVKYGHHDGTLGWFARYVPDGFITTCP